MTRKHKQRKHKTLTIKCSLCKCKFPSFRLHYHHDASTGTNRQLCGRCLQIINTRG